MLKDFFSKFRENYFYSDWDSLLEWEDKFITHMLFHFKHQLNTGSKIFYINGFSKHQFSLNPEDWEYLSNGLLKTQEKFLLSDFLKNPDELDFVFSENIKQIKCSQRHDLFFLTSLKNLDMLVLIPKLDKFGHYYFDIILVVNRNFNDDKIKFWDLSSIKINEVIEIIDDDLTVNNFKKIFDVIKHRFKDFGLRPVEVNLYKKHYIGCGENAKLSKTGLRIYKKLIFKLICTHIYWFNNKLMYDKKSYNLYCSDDYVFNASLIKMSETHSFVYLTYILCDTSFNYPVSWYEFYKF